MAMNDPTPTTWDIINAIHFSTLNQTLKEQWQPINIKCTKTISLAGGTIQIPYSLDATLAPWQITEGGDGQNVRFKCPIQSGTLSLTPSGKDPFTYTFPTTGDLTTILIEVKMEWLPDPSQQFFVIDDQTTSVDSLVTALDSRTAVPDTLVKLFAENNITLPSSATVTPKQTGLEWTIDDDDKTTLFYIFYTRQLDSNQDIHAEYLYVYKVDQKLKANLKVLETDLSSGDASPVTVENILNPIPGIDDTSATALGDMVSEWFNVNLNQFNQIFAQANITLTLDQNSNFKWLIPTATSYAVTDAETLNEGIFGILIMTGGSNEPDTSQVPQNAIPDGCDAAFIISGPLFVQNMLLPGAMAVLGIQDLSYFTTTTDQGVQVQLAKDYSWGPFITDDTPLFGIYMGPDDVQDFDQGDLSILSTHFDDWGWVSTYNKVIVRGQQWLLSIGDKQYIVEYSGRGDVLSNIYRAATITIPAKQFSLTLDNDQVMLNLTNFSYPYPGSSDYTINVNYQESWTLGLKELNGQNIFWFTDVSGQKMTVTVTQTQGAITREIVEGVIGGLVALITTVAAVGAAFQSTAVIETAANEGTAAIEATEEVDQAIGDNANEVVAGETATAIAQEEGYVTRLSNVLGSAKWKVAGALTATCVSVAGIDVGIDKLIASVAQGNPQATLPDFNAFLEASIQPYSWPGVKGFDLVSASLSSGAVVIGLKAQQTS